MAKCSRSRKTCVAEMKLDGSLVVNDSAGFRSYVVLVAVDVAAVDDRYICIADKAPSAKHFS